MSRRSGFALIVAIFVILLFAVLGVVVVSLLSGENIAALRDYNSVRAFQLAEAGIRYTVASSLAADSDWSDNAGFSKDLGAGSFTISYLQQEKRRVILRSVGSVGGINRTLTVNIRKSGLPDAFDFGMFSSNPDETTLYIQNEATIYGGYYFNGPVVMQNSSRLLNGTLFSTSLELQHDAYCASWEPVPEIPFPAFDPSYYDNLLAETSKGAVSALDISSGTLDLGGGTHYYTSVTVRGDAVVTGTGTLVATTGDFTLSNTARLGDNITVIFKGNATLDNSSGVGANFNLIGYGDVEINNTQNVPPEAIFFSYGNITWDNISQYWGSILAPSGEISSLNGTTFNGLLYSNSVNLQNDTHLNGAAVVQSVGYFKNFAVVTYDPAKLPSTIPEGFEGAGESTEEGLYITDWAESF